MIKCVIMFLLHARIQEFLPRGGGGGGGREDQGVQAHLKKKTSDNVFLLLFFFAVLLVLTFNLFNRFTEGSNGLLLGKL